MSIVIYIGHSNGTVPKASLVSITAAKALAHQWKKGKITGFCCGPHASQAAKQIAAYGLDEVLYSEHEALATYESHTWAHVLLEVVAKVGADTVVSTATSTGKDLMPRFTALWDGGMASDIIAVNDDGSLKRPMYAGDVIADVELLTAKRVVTVRGSAFSAPIAEGNAQVTEMALAQCVAPLSTFKSQEVSAAERPELTDATIIVSGGRALQSHENFEKVLFPLADSLGAAVGASRAAVDSGYAPNDWQVGQTGKIVAPQLYVAVGISGAIQHLAGMKDSKCIVAINKDGEAPIFEIADYGLVADLYEAVPQVTAEIHKRKG